MVHSFLHSFSKHSLRVYQLLGPESNIGGAKIKKKKRWGFLAWVHEASVSLKLLQEAEPASAGAASARCHTQHGFNHRN
jgi:hypothetical protein